MSHAAAGRSGLPGNESHYGFPHIFIDEIRRHFLGIAANFANHHDRMRFRVVIEHANDVEKARPDDRIASNSNAGRLADSQARKLPYGFVGERAATTYDADV